MPRWICSSSRSTLLRPNVHKLATDLHWFSTSERTLGKAPNDLLDLKALEDEEHHRLAESWVQDFRVDDIPKKAYETTFARSSGPGGQHVNTTSSKAVVRMALSPALGIWLPRYLMPHLVKSPHYLPSPPSLLVSSQISRTASSNASSALGILHSALLEAAKGPIVGETSEKQKERVRGLVKAEKSRVRLMKEKQKSTKAGRRGEF